LRLGAGAFLLSSSGGSKKLLFTSPPSPSPTFIVSSEKGSRTRIKRMLADVAAAADVDAALPLLPSHAPFLIEERVNFPGLTLDYVLGALDPTHMEGHPYIVKTGASGAAGQGEDEEERHSTFATLLGDVTFTYPQPEDVRSRHGTSAYAWFADRGEWLYALEGTQRNAFVPAAFPSWLRMLANRVHAASTLTRLTGHGWNCCLVSYGVRSTWTYGEDPWHDPSAYVADVFIGDGVRLTVRNAKGKGLRLNPQKGGILTWRGDGDDWSMVAHSETLQPMFRLSFRTIDPCRENRQKALKYPHRLRDALRAEQRLVPCHLNTGERDRVIQGHRFLLAGTSAINPVAGTGTEAEPRKPRAAAVTVEDPEAVTGQKEPAPKKPKKAPPRVKK
jgi:hypothetical protein